MTGQADRTMEAAVRLQNRVWELRRELERAAFLFGALGHDGEHDDCDPCDFVRRQELTADDKVAFDEEDRR